MCDWTKKKLKSKNSNKRVDPLRWFITGGAGVGKSHLAKIISSYLIKTLGDYKCRKVTETDFWKKILIWRYSRKGFQISPNSDTSIFGWLVGNAVFSEAALRIFLGFFSLS